MRRDFVYAVLLATALAAPATNYSDDDTCEPDWIDTSKDGSSISSAAASTPSGVITGNDTSQSGAKASSASNSTISMPTRPDGSASVPNSPTDYWDYQS